MNIVFSTFCFVGFMVYEIPTEIIRFRLLSPIGDIYRVVYI